MSNIASHMPLNILPTGRDGRFVPKNQQQAYRESSGHVTDDVTWPWMVKFVTLKRNLYLEPFFQIGSKHIGVTSLTFRGHTMSSVTWSFDSPYPISYWWRFGTESLSPAVFKIIGL